VTKNASVRLIENWPWYAKNVDKFHAENLGSLIPATTRKLFTPGKFYRVPEHRDSFDVLKNWIQLGDGSRFSRGHLEIRELSEPGRVEDLKFLGYYAIMLYQRGIAFYATKDCTEGTLAKIGQFLRSFQGMYFPLSI
jgi:hypothetical protein